MTTTFRRGQIIQLRQHPRIRGGASILFMGKFAIRTRNWIFSALPLALATVWTVHITRAQSFVITIFFPSRSAHSSPGRGLWWINRMSCGLKHVTWIRILITIHTVRVRRLDRASKSSGTSGFRLSAGVEWKRLDYEDDTPYQEYYSRDGDIYSCGLDSYLYLLDNRVLAGLHYHFRRDNTEGQQYELRSNDLAVSVRAALPWALRLRARVGYQEEDYLEFFHDPPGRLDDIWSFHFALQRMLWHEAVSLELSYTYLTSSSSQDFAEYERSVAGIGLIMNY